MEKPTPLTASRRAFFGFAAVTIASMPAMRANPQKANRNSELSGFLRELRLAKEFKDASLYALSADGTEMCVYFTRHPNTTFTLRPGQKGGIESGNPKDEELAIIQMDSWKKLFSCQLRGNPSRASFFLENQALYVEVHPNDFKAIQQVVIDIPSGYQQERLQTVIPDGPLIDYHAFSGRTLVGTESGTPPARHAALIRAMLPDYQEVTRVPYAVPPDQKPDGDETAIVISADRKTIAYAFGHTIVCRRTEDFAVLWTQRIDSEFFGAGRVTVSANGNRVAVAVIDTTLWDYQRKFYVGIYNGRDGKEIARLPVNGDKGIAVSPDGGLLAVGKNIAKSKDIQLQVEIYDIASGLVVLDGTHDRIFPGRFQILNGRFDGLHFTSDGKYLAGCGKSSRAA